MAYIKPPEPADSTIIWPATDDRPAFTWGDHKQMQAMLDEIEDDNPGVASARLKLDGALEELFGPTREPELVCEFCWQPQSKPHDADCRDNNDPALWVKREALSYQYLDSTMRVIHTSSVPMTDQEALEYFGIVELMFPEEVHPRYITRKALDSNKWDMMPYWYEFIENRVWPIEQKGA